MDPDEAQSLYSPVRRKRRWLRFLLRAIGGLLLTLVLLVIVISLAENLLGARAWKAYVDGAKARGQWFEPKDLIPAPVPEAQNFALIPLLKPLWDYTLEPDPDHPPLQNTVWRDPQAKNHLDEIKISGSLVKPTSWRRGEFAELVRCQQCLREEAHLPGPMGNPAEDVLRALDKFTPDLDALRLGAATHPYCRFPLHYEEAFRERLPHLIVLSQLSLILQLRERAELSLGKTDAALEDAMLQFRLIEATSNEPILITLLVRITQMEGALGSLWEGIERHEWSDDQLAKLDAALARFDAILAYQNAIRGELTLSSLPLFALMEKGLFSGLIAFTSGQGGGSMRGGDRNNYPGEFLLYPLNQGWLNFNRAAVGESCDRWIRVADPKGHRFSVGLATQAQEALGASKLSLLQKTHHLLAAITTSVYSGAASRVAGTQALVDQGRVAIALERYWLGHGQYPDGLEQLAEYLPKVPHDVITGQPLHYHKDPQSGYVLYSVGWNGKDDGGVTAWRKTDPSRIDLSQGDWVWPHHRG